MRSSSSSSWPWLVGLAIRLALVAYGERVDAVSRVRYTDIDYDVYTDGARFVSQGQSPYLRLTYRYTPLLAWLLVPNVWVSRAWGKLVFVCLDMCVDGDPVLWLLNPFVFSISTRGNADVLVVALVLAAWRLGIERGRVVWGGLVYGLAVHTKIYPVIYGLALLRALPDTRRRVLFVVAAAAAFAALFATCYALYGWEFVEHTYLYHVSRKDTRHNFSVYFYATYLRDASSLLWFLPQAAIVVAASMRLPPRRALLVSTMAFVVFNKVITAQYFVWFLGLWERDTPRSYTLLAVWVAAEALWLFVAFHVEFEGQAWFRGLFGAGCLFFVAGVANIVYVCRATQQEQMTTLAARRRRRKDKKET